MIEMITEMFSYSFMVHAIVAGLFLSLCASLLGVSLVLKRYSMIGDGLSHIGFGALAVASAANLAPLGVERGEGELYFCTPRGASMIGWEGADGIHYCFVRGCGGTVFAVSPMNTAPMAVQITP